MDRLSSRESIRLLGRLLRLAKPHSGWLALGIFLSLLTILASVSLLAVSGWFIAAMASAGLAGITMNYFTPAGVIRFLAIVRTAGRYGERLVTHNATFKLISELRVWFYQRLEPLAPAGLQKLRAGDVLNRLQSDVDALDHFYLRVLLPFAVALLAVPLIVFVVWLYDSMLALGLLLCLLVVGVLIPLWVGWQTRRAGHQQVQETARLRAALIDTVQGLRELQLYQAIARQQRRCQGFSDALQQQQLRINVPSAGALALTTLVVGVMVWGALWWLIPQVSSGARPAVELVMLVLLAMAAFETVQPMPLALEQLPVTLAAAQRIFSLADKTVVRPEPDQPVTVDGYDLVLQRVNFRYPDTEHRVLRDLSLTIKAGERVAIVGRSGAGKSSLLQLLMGFWPLTEGQVKLGSADINQLDSETLRRCFAVAAQHSHLFSETVAANLRLADPEANDQQLQRVCEQAGIWQRIEQLPEGLNTYVGEGGLRLSGGEQRRLSVAQALLKPAPILILDEPSEGLDVLTEQQLCQSLLAGLAERTLLLITHRPAMLAQMDRVTVLDEGRIILDGPHHQLLHDDRYRDLLYWF